MTTITCVNCSNEAKHTYRSRNLKSPLHYCFSCLPSQFKKIVRAHPGSMPLDVPTVEAPKASKKKAKVEEPVVEEPVVEEAPAVVEEPVADENNQD